MTEAEFFKVLKRYLRETLADYESRPPAKDPYQRGINHGWEDSSRLILSLIKERV